VVVNPDDLSDALDKGRMPELPPSITPGWLGEVAPNLRKTDDFEPTLSAGILQEGTWETRWLVLLLLYVLVITSPVALWLLWREPHRKTWSKALATALGVAGYVALFLTIRR
jgi:hypothetical protein